MGNVCCNGDECCDNCKLTNICPCYNNQGVCANMKGCSGNCNSKNPNCCCNNCNLNNQCPCYSGDGACSDKSACCGCCNCCKDSPEAQDESNKSDQQWFNNKMKK